MPGEVSYPFQSIMSLVLGAKLEVGPVMRVQDPIRTIYTVPDGSWTAMAALFTSTILPYLLNRPEPVEHENA